MQLLFVPIAIVVNLADNIDKLRAKEVPFAEILNHYYNFSIYFSSSLLPLFLFLAITWFTSKLSANSEIIAIYSSGISIKEDIEAIYCWFFDCCSIFIVYWNVCSSRFNQKV